MAGMATVSIPQELPLGVVGGGWTAADLELLPDDGRRYEIIDGVLIVSPAPALPHQRASRRLARLLEDSCPDGLEAFFAPLDWQVSQTTAVQPDLMVVRREDASGLKLAGTPVLVVEVLSPSTAEGDRTRKFDAYAAAGLGQYWIVDPGSGGTAPSVEVYDLAEPGGYGLQVRGSGDQQVAVAGPVLVSVTPAELMA